MTDTAERPYHHGSLRDTLLRAAEETLREQGQEELSLRELARKAGVSHAAPRRHFADRQALLDALAITGFERLGAQVTAAVERADADFPSRLRALAHAFVRFATRDAALLELMFSSKHREGAEEVRASARNAFSSLDEVIEQGRETGALDLTDRARGGIVLVASLQGIATMINGGMVEPELLEELTDQAVEQFLLGCAAG